MSMLAYDHVCDPISMFQDSFSISEFILGPMEETSNQSLQDMLKSENDIKQEIDPDQPRNDNYQVAVSGDFQGTQAPCSYMYQQHEPTSPASCSSSCSSASLTPNSYPHSYGYNYEYSRHLPAYAREDRTISQNPLAHLGYGGRDRRHDEELSLQEREKRKIRRERNKEAALRCRTRRRERIDVLEKETEDLESQNKVVEDDISCLQMQLKQLERMLLEHQCDKGL